MGPQECTGMLLVAVGFVMMVSETRINKWFIFPFLLAAFEKENFVFVLIAAWYFKFFYDYYKKNKGIKVILKENMVALIISLVTFGGIVGYILVNQGDAYFVGESMTFMEKILSKLQGIVSNTLKGSFRFYTIILVIVFIGGWIVTWKNKDAFKKFWINVGALIVVVGPQLLVYADTNMNERYLLPATFGCACFVCIFGARLLEDTIPNKKVVMCILALFTVFLSVKQGDIFIKQGKSFYATGYNYQKVMDTAVELSDEDDSILCAYEWGEYNWGAQYYLWTHGKNSIFTLDSNGQISSFRSSGEIEKPEYILVNMNNLDKVFSENTSLKKEEYEQIAALSNTQALYQYQGM